MTTQTKAEVFAAHLEQQVSAAYSAEYSAVTERRSLTKRDEDGERVVTREARTESEVADSARTLAVNAREAYARYLSDKYPFNDKNKTKYLLKKNAPDCSKCTKWNG